MGRSVTAATAAAVSTRWRGAGARNKALALYQPHHTRPIRWHGAMDDAHMGQAAIRAGPTEQLANNALTARCGAAAQAYPVERRVDRGCHEVIFLPLETMPEVSAMMARALRGPSGKRTVGLVSSAHTGTGARRSRPQA